MGELLDWPGASAAPQGLREALLVAVPLWMERRWDWLDEDLIAHARLVWLSEDYAAAQHEALLYRVKAHKRNGKRVPGTAEVFNFFADALACMALATVGGVTVMGLHFCPASAGGDPCERCTKPEPPSSR